MLGKEYDITKVFLIEFVLSRLSIGSSKEIAGRTV